MEPPNDPSGDPPSGRPSDGLPATPGRPPGRAIWIAWALAFLGGVAVIVAVATALWHPCLDDGRTLTTTGCAGTSASGWVLGLTAIGTVLAVVGGLTATVLTVRVSSRPRAAGTRHRRRGPRDR